MPTTDGQLFNQHYSPLHSNPAPTMRIPSNPFEAFILSTLLFPLFTTAFNIDCHHVRVKSKDFDLSPLGGPRSVLHSVDEGLSFKNTTYTIDICRSLSRRKDVPKDHQCPFGTRGKLHTPTASFEKPCATLEEEADDRIVCSIERLIKKEEGEDILEAVIPIAGDLKDKGGSDMNAKWELMGSQSSSHEDAEKEGIRVNMNGGFFGTGKEKRPQKAIVEFLCDKSRTGLENLWTPEDEDQYEEGKDKWEEKGDEGDDVADKDSPSLEFVKYDVDAGDADILRLKWRTRYACEGAKKKLDQEKAKSWGFFTWFILMCVFQHHHESLSLGTDIVQCFPLHSNISHLRLVAQLQSVRCSRLGSTTPRRYDTRCSVFAQRLVEEGPQYSTRTREPRGVRGSMTARNGWGFKQEKRQAVATDMADNETSRWEADVIVLQSLEQGLGIGEMHRCISR